MLKLRSECESRLCSGFDELPGCLVGNSDFELGFYINNLLGNQPLCNAWGYEIAFLSGEEPYRETGYYVLAPRHYMLKFVFKI
jgi:hypothetical protein